MPKLIALALTTTLLCGCGTPPGSCEHLSLREYDDAFKSKMLGEYPSIPESGAIDIFVQDSIALRDDVRACKGIKP